MPKCGTCKGRKPEKEFIGKRGQLRKSCQSCIDNAKRLSDEKKGIVRDIRWSCALSNKWAKVRL